MMGTYDVVIIGAGPAGLFLASELADSGLRILVLDKKKNAEDVGYDTLGSFLRPGDEDIPPSIFNPIDTVRFSSKNEFAIKKGKASIIDRRKLLTHFEKRATKNKNLDMIYGAEVIGPEIRDGHVREVSYQKSGKCQSVGAKIFLDCSGPGAVLAREMGLVPDKLKIAAGMEYHVPLKTAQHETDLLVGSDLEGGYGWIFPLDSKVAIIGYGTLSEDRFADIEESLKSMWNIKRVSERCGKRIIKRQSAILRTGKPLKSFRKNNLLVLGDTALQANPLVGEGVRFAMDSARMAAKAIKESLQMDDLAPLDKYSKEWKKKYYRSYKRAYALQNLIKGDSGNDIKMDNGVRMLRRMSDEDFARLLSGEIGTFSLIGFFMKSLLK